MAKDKVVRVAIYRGVAVSDKNATWMAVRT